MKGLSQFLRKIITFWTMKNKVKIMIFEALLLTGIYRLVILLIPFDTLRESMGEYNEESPKILPNTFDSTIKLVGWAVRKIASETPWETKCLVQALTAQRMLNRRHICTTLYLGVKKKEARSLMAHSWVRCGKYIVTGGEGCEDFCVVAKFSNFSM